MQYPLLRIRMHRSTSLKAIANRWSKASRPPRKPFCGASGRARDRRHVLTYRQPVEVSGRRGGK